MERRPFIYYLITFAGMSIYGSQVCPYIDDLAFLDIISVQAIYFIPVFMLRHFFLKRYLDRVPLLEQPQRQLIVEISLFISIGLLLTVHNYIVYDFPFGSGLKVILGMAVFGFFFSLDLALLKARGIIEEMINRRDESVRQTRFFSLPNKLILIGMVAASLLTVVVVLLVIKDFDWLAMNMDQHEVRAAQLSVIREILFVVGGLLALGFNVLLSYSRNLKLYFDSETNVLENVSRGKLDGFVPVTSNDEFSIIARHTNQMIEGLKDKERIQSMFGKFVSPVLIQKYLDQHREITLGGVKENLVILFSDIRNFTGISEKNQPETVINILNEYFSAMVEAITRHHGIVDKFIGDGLLAVFGIDDKTNAAGDAVACALEMVALARSQGINRNLAMEIGVGIHGGEVIAGVIGSPDRLEFTFIGDVVNIASRLESMTKEVGMPVVISAAVFDSLLDRELAARFIGIGARPLKGKNIPIEMYGLKTP